jgi:hypothetical protein
MTSVRRRHPETWKRRTRVRIAKPASRLSKFVVAGHLSGGATTKIPRLPLGGVYLRGSFFFRLPSHNPSGERMAAIS